MISPRPNPKQNSIEQTTHTGVSALNVVIQIMTMEVTRVPTMG